MRATLFVLGFALAVGGCRAGGRGWQRLELSTHDRQTAFDAARDVLGRHFELGRVSWARGTLETRPQGFDGPRSGTLADVRGAGGRWRRRATCRIERDGLTIVACVAVRTEREATAAAEAMYETGRDARASEVPPTAPPLREPGARAPDEVWMEVGYDAALAREILSEIAERVRRKERSEQAPLGRSPSELVEESRRIGAEEGF